jgi:hypothetical protein
MNAEAQTGLRTDPRTEPQAEPRRVIVTANLCGVCDTETVLVFHQLLPELRISGKSAEEAAGHLADRLWANLDFVTDPAHQEPIERAIADVRAFLDREGAAHPAREFGEAVRRASDRRGGGEAP